MTDPGWPEPVPPTPPSPPVAPPMPPAPPTVPPAWTPPPAPSVPQYAPPTAPPAAPPAAPGWGPPQQPQYAPPAAPQYAQPAAPQYAPPAAPQYASPAAPPAAPGWGAPAAPTPYSPPAPAAPQYAAPAPSQWGSAQPTAPPVATPGTVGRRIADPAPDLGTRALARLVDAAVVFLVGYLAAVVFGRFGPMNGIRPYGSATIGPQIAFLVVTILAVAYEPAMLAWRGQTVGKWATGIRVKLPENKPIGVFTAIRRHLPSIVLRLGFIIAIVRFMDNPSNDAGFIADAQNRVGEQVSSVMLLGLLLLAGINLVLLVVGGRSVYDRLGGTTVVVNTQQPDPPLAGLMSKIEDLIP